jgi:hypothetical protein
MSRERTNIAGIVVITILITTVVIGAGWFGASRYLARHQTASAPPDEAPAAPAPRRKGRTAKNVSGRGGSQEAHSPNDAAPVGASTVPEGDTARAREENDPTSAAGRGSALPSPDAAPASGREEKESAAAPPAAVAAAPVVGSHGEARTIMEESQRRTDAKSYQYEGLLQSFDAKNKVTEKRWLFDRVGSHGRSKSVLRFTSPPEVKGVALLIGNHPDRASDQWMWTPAIERDRRIALQDRSTRFFGTDFSFEDLEERDVDQYDYSMLGNEPIDGADCWKIALTPKPGRSSQYSRGIAWVRKDNYAFARLDNFVKDEVVKRLTYSTLENIQGIWTARQLEMSDLHRGSRTRLTLQEIRYNVPTKDDDFTLQAIRR